MHYFVSFAVNYLHIADTMCPHMGMYSKPVNQSHVNLPTVNIARFSLFDFPSSKSLYLAEAWLDKTKTWP